MKVESKHTVNKINEYFEAYEKSWPVNGSILVAKDGEVMFQKGFGLANMEHNLANKEDTVFLIGSITKSFTAILIMMLYERGLLNVSDPISDYISDCPEAWNKIMLQHLLNHTSGIAPYTAASDWIDKQERLYYTHEELIEIIKDRPLNFEPGEKGEYSNSGYYLLGVIIEKITGKSYEDFLRESILKPLNMNSTGIYYNKSLIKNRAYPYELDGEDFVNGRHVEMANVFSAGSIYSTLEDMLIFDQALHNNKLISKSSLEKMTQTSNCIDEVVPYGYGLYVTEIFGHKRIGHEGGLCGFLTQWYHYTEENITIIIFANAYLNVWKIGDDLAAIVFGQDYKLPKRLELVRIDEKLLNEYCGSYAHPVGIIRIFPKEGKVYFQLEGEKAVEILPIAENKFTHKIIEEYYEFQRNEQSGEMEMVLYGEHLKKIG